MKHLHYMEVGKDSSKCLKVSMSSTFCEDTEASNIAMAFFSNLAMANKMNEIASLWVCAKPGPCQTDLHTLLS